MKRKIVKIDEELCNGCSLCIPNCQEGALQIIDGKVRLISDLFCDGLGACLGHCPEGAISIEEREAEPYDERKVMEIISKQGENTMIAHLNHLKDHGEIEYYNQALEYLKENNISINLKTESKMENHSQCGCPGSKTMSFDTKPDGNTVETNVGSQKSELRQWPVQMHLVNPMAPYFKDSDLLLAADCVPFSMGNFHSTHLKGRSLAIACPKLDANQDVYIDKLVKMIDESKINTITVMIMEVPCCGGLLRMAQIALEKATRKVPVKSIVVSLQGEIIQESWM
ncbi:MAG: 4Fe-4S binding protein [Bacteroidia bacterium]|nr:4Fe-4S binding protein [Bacteroidia bacterium]